MLCIKKILIAPLAAVTLAALLSVTPTPSPDLPVLSTLQPQPAEAHTATKQETRWRDVNCREITYQAREIVYWEPETQAYPYRRPIYGWVPRTKTVCDRESYTVTVDRSHWHPPKRVVCEVVPIWVGTFAGTATAGATAPAAPATAGMGTAAAAATAGTAGYFTTKKICKTIVPEAIYLDWFTW